MRRREGGHGYANLVYLCPTCHRWAHGSPAAAARDGYIIPVSAGVAAISSHPIRTFDGWVLFTSDGGLEPADTPEREAS